MKDKNIDKMLFDSLKPELEPSEDLNQKLMEKLNNSSESTDVTKRANIVKSVTPVSIFLKAAAVIIIVLALGSAGVYAANHILKKTTVYDHGVSVGNQDFIDDETLAEPFKEAEVKDESHVDGGPNDKWLTKDVKTTGGLYKNTYYEYPDYNTAVSDTGFSNIFSVDIGTPYSITYVTTEEIGANNNDTTTATVNDAEENVKYESAELDSTFNYNDGIIFLCQSKSSGVSDDSAYSVSLLNGTSNKRTYKTTNDIEFTLVDTQGEEFEGVSDDKIVTTYVMLSYDDIDGYISFRNLSEEDIHSVLDKINLSSEGE